jgi:hypothetical protein
MLALRPRSSAVHTEDGAGRKWNVKRIRPSPMLHAPKVAIRNAIGSRALAALAALAALNRRARIRLLTARIERLAEEHVMR